MDRSWFRQRLHSWGRRPALMWRGEYWSFSWLCETTDAWLHELERQGIKPGNTLAICGDYSPMVCGLVLAAVLNRNVVVPLASAAAPRWNRLMELAQVKFAIRFDSSDAWDLTRFDRAADHPLLRQLKERDAPGLVLFSSGSTGESKGSVLDFDELLTKFKAPRPSYRMLVFLLLDHIGGVNTLLYGLCHGGTIVTARERSPDAICATIEEHRVQLLPTTPTFLRLLLIADSIRRYDLSSLKIITYGTEPMPPSTLMAIREALPWVRFKQTYGLSEVGILSTQSRDSGSVWLKLGDTRLEHKIVDGVLWIRSPSVMLGYLNAPSPFDANGWFNTQDLVEKDGEYIRILGRKSELINVGGEKVHPTEIENLLLQLDNVKDVTVRGQSNPITGEIVAAKITPLVQEDPAAFKQRVREFCRARLERYKVPAVIEVVTEDHYGARFKKSRVDH